MNKKSVNSLFDKTEIPETVKAPLYRLTENIGDVSDEENAELTEILDSLTDDELRTVFSETFHISAESVPKAETCHIKD